MDIKERIAKVKDRAAKLALKTVAVATLLGGSGTAVSCSESIDRNTDENGNKIEKVGGEKTSVVFRVKQAVHGGGGAVTDNMILLENGDQLRQTVSGKFIDDKVGDGMFLEPGDTVTYKGNNVKAVRYKSGSGKQVNFGNIGKLEKDITD